MRSRFTILVACALALALPSTASAAFTVGISENEASMFYDPLFQGVGFKQARVIVGYDVALNPAGDDYGLLKEYLAAAASSAVEPLVSCQHKRGAASWCDQTKNFTKGICKLPRQTAYTAAMKAFFASFPSV